jgi:putative endonuclease
MVLVLCWVIAEPYFLIFDYGGKILSMYILYLIQHTTTYQIYIGITNNLKRRLLEHNKGGTCSTKRKSGEWILIYAEAYRNKSDVVEREQKLKQRGSAIHKLKKRIQGSFLEIKK